MKQSKMIVIGTYNVPIKITFDPNGGQLNGTDDFELDFPYDINDISLPTPSKSSDQLYTYKFSKWNTQPNGSGIDLEDIVLEDDITFYAIYAATPIMYTITFDANGGTPATQTKTLPSGSSLVLPPNPTRANSGDYSYTFKGWFTSTSGETQVNTNTKVTGNVTYYAQWNSAISQSVQNAINFVNNYKGIQYQSNNQRIFYFDADSNRVEQWLLGTLPTNNKLTRNGSTVTIKAGYKASSINELNNVEPYARFKNIKNFAFIDNYKPPKIKSGTISGYNNNLNLLFTFNLTSEIFEYQFTSNITHYGYQSETKYIETASGTTFKIVLNF